MTLFKDYLSIQPPNIPADRQTKYIDSILRNLQDKDPEKGVYGLKVDSTATNAARLTSHGHYYSPAKVKKASSTFLEPYEKPVLIAHDRDSDPIGRVKYSMYESIKQPMIKNNIIAWAYRDVEHNPEYLSGIRKLQPFLYTRGFEGLGKIKISFNITDENAIPKIVDGRYNTMSVGYGSPSVVCSECFADWGAGNFCEHSVGKSYEHGRMFLIFGDLEYNEISYVNVPANAESKTENIKRILIPVNVDIDSVNDLNINSESYDEVNMNSNIMLAYLNDSGDYVIIGENLNNKQTISGDKMTIKELTSLAMADFYAKITDFIPEDKRLDEAKLQELKDEDFIGPNRTFPVVDAEHISACIELIKDFEDSDEKTEIMSFLDVRAKALDSDGDTSQSNDDEKTDGSTDQKEEVVTITLRKVDNVYSLDENENISYSDVFNAVFAKMVAEDGFINSVIESLTKDEELKTKFITIISDKFNLSESKNSEIDSLNETVTRQRQEYKILKDTLDATDVKVKALSSELKSLYIDMIAELKDGEDPDGSDNWSDYFKDKNLNEVKTAVEVAQKLYDSSNPASKVTNPVNSFVKTHSEQDVARLEALIPKTAEEIRRKHGNDAAEGYIRYQTQKLLTIKQNLTKNKQ